MTNEFTTAAKEKEPAPEVLRSGADWKNLFFYQKSDVLYQLTFVFCKRFLPAHGDRTVDQMVQAARSGKQNIVEGSEDGKSSSEMELRLINVARGSLQELREDYEDYLNTRGLMIWKNNHPRYNAMLAFCRKHNVFADYEPYLNRWNAEEFCNIALSLCHIVDRMMCSYLDRLQKQYKEHGGIKERMYAARTGYRKQQDQQFQLMKAENARLKAENERLKAENARLKAENARLKAALEAGASR